jgi:starch synthase
LENERKTPNGGKMMAEIIKVLFLASEADPLIKVGGLGDVAGSLPYALRSLDPSRNAGVTIDIRLVIPFHSAIRSKLDSQELVASFDIAHSNGPIPIQVYQTDINGLPIYLISAPPFSPGEPVYTTDSYRDGIKYTLFSIAALEMTRHINWIPDVIHANDWHTAVIPYIARNDDNFEELNTIPTVLSVHNLPYLGAGAENALTEFGIPPSDDPRLPEWSRHMPLPLGLVSADRIIAVSASYAEEILTPEFGCGLDDFLQTRKENVMGILNGLDQANWDPSTDNGIPAKFSYLTLSEREKNRKKLIDEVGLNPDPAIPLIIVISRMDHQKGIDLVIETLYQVSKSPWQAIILGTGTPIIEASCQHLMEDFPDRVRSILRFDGQLARRMYAGGDMILMPSRYEPCGLAQMIAMRYGCIPVARATGGLRDTVQNVSSPGATGFLFKDATSTALSEALNLALQVYSNQAEWKMLQVRGMQMDFSWQRSAYAYAQVYKTLKEQNA